MSNSTSVLGGVEGSFAVARVAMLRVLRGRALWVVAGLSLLPLAWAGLLRAANAEPGAAWQSTCEVWAFLLAILAPVLLAGSIAEEIEEGTSSYLWSRPLPRWSIMGGKLAALVPTLCAILLISLLLTCLLYPNGLDEPGRILPAVILGVIGIAATTAGIAAIAPKYGTLISLAYLVLVDRNLAWFSGSIGKISVAYHFLNLAHVHDAGETPLTATMWLLGMSVFWFAIAGWRVRRID